MNEKTIRRLRVWRDGTKAAKDDGLKQTQTPLERTLLESLTQVAYAADEKHGLSYCDCSEEKQCEYARKINNAFALINQYEDDV